MENNETNKEPQGLTGLQKAALVLIAMGESTATEVIKGFSDSEIEKITVAIAKYRHIDADDIGAAIEEFFQMIEGKKHILSGGISYAKKILEDAWGLKKAEEIIQRVEATTEVSAFYLLQTVDDKQLLNFLSNEHPQTVALILANLRSVQAAAILSDLPEEMQGEISYRLATMEKTSPELIREIENALREQLGSVFGGQMSKIGGTEAIAEILNSTSRTAEKNILDSIESRNPKLFEEIKNLMFTFEDVEKLSDAAIQRITREIDSKTLALSLKAASPSLKDKITRNMSERAAEMLNDELQYLGPVRVKEVETAQSVILDAIRDLDDAGEINMAAGEEEMIE
jgi:flagellar motor switch protein FliG